MFDKTKEKRPPLPERYEHFRDIVTMIEWLRAAYEETRNEKVLLVLNMLAGERNQHAALEDVFREQELQEFWNNPGLFPESVRIWFFQYRDKELQ